VAVEGKEGKVRVVEVAGVDWEDRSICGIEVEA
jgi:hypothetical protein